MTEPKLEQSDVEKAIQARGRTFHRFEIDGFLGLAGKPSHVTEICVPKKHEEDGAVIAAHAYARKRAAEDEEARNDPDLLTDAKIVELLWRCLYQPLPVQPEGAPPVSRVRYPTFTAGPDWMRKNLTSDQLAILRNLLDSCVAKESPLVREIDNERVEIMARLCWTARDTDVPEAVLADRTRAYLTDAFTLLAIKYAKAMGWDVPVEPEAPEPESASAAEESEAEPDATLGP